ncbi:DNA repair protein RadC [Thermanaerosceptrum fracticalcis]|uniref:DNA repair protein RadC n=1 Tax=Thermanaerosceptrum fracticalcis TaxID=1712410 RepID=A0A7G6E677_THEFR|nr:DNA repair protein RadC [Thermanaerosceptrum fracticalcis]QNB47581.1 DNA repair protein RadC [Thermanaerosceptrum fracticalcis]
MKKISQTGHVSIKNFPEEVRPREKMLVLGAEALSDQELLAILLRTGTKNKSALDLAQDILSTGGLATLTQLTLEELGLRKGIGLAKAAQLKAAVELGKRLAKQRLGPKPAIKSPQEAAQFVMNEMMYLDREHFRVINLNTKNQILAVDTVSIGSLDASLVHPREVFKLPIKRSAASLILIHNHPSGDTSPSREDIEVTKRLAEAGRLLGINILDHIIIGHNNFLSMKEKEYF